MKVGTLLPHVDVTSLDGDLVPYATIWQRRNLVLVMLPAEWNAATARYAAQLSARASDFAARETACVITSQPPPGFPVGIIVTDRWGEIAHVLHGSTIEDFPGTDALLEWIDYLRMRCPECEGEAR